MPFSLFVLYLALSYIHPAELFPALAPYRVTLWVGLAGIASVLVSLLVRGRPSVTNCQLWLVLCFTAVMGVSLMIAERWLGAPIFALQRFGPSLTMFVLAIGTVTSLRRLRMAAGLIVGLALILLLQGAAAYHFGYNAHLFLLKGTAADDDVASEAPDGGWDVGSPSEEWNEDVENAASQQRPRIRALGFMHDPNDLAIGMIVALGLIGGTWRPTLQFRHVLLAMAAAALMYGIYLTGSRGGAVALVVVLWRIAAARVGRVPGLLLLALLSAGVAAVDFGGRSFSSELDASASGRLEAWGEGLEMLKAQPLFGVGYGRFLDYHTLTAHNSLVLCFSETGLLGSFFWVGLFVVTLLELRGLKQLSGAEPFDRIAGPLAEGLQLSLLGFVAAAFFLSRTFVPTLYLIIGLSAALASIARGAGRPVHLPRLSDFAALVLACEVASIGLLYAIVKLHAA